jgi:hypothetical protein
MKLTSSVVHARTVCLSSSVDATCTLPQVGLFHASMSNPSEAAMMLLPNAARNSLLRTKAECLKPLDAGSQNVHTGTQMEKAAGANPVMASKTSKRWIVESSYLRPSSSVASSGTVHANDETKVSTMHIPPGYHKGSWGHSRRQSPQRLSNP